LDAKTFQKFLGEGHRIASIQIGDKTEQGLVREVQYDALGSQMLHVDFTRIRQDQEVEIEVPVETVGVPKGVSAGGILSFPVQELLIAGLPGDVPESYQIEIESLEVGQHIRLKDLVPPPKCTFQGDPDTVILAVDAKRGAEEVPAAPAEGEPTQPEVISRKKESEEEGKED
jgi:large subunit ribosomal protein L25